MKTSDAMTVGQLAQQAGVNVETVRYYHRRQLLPLPPRPPGSIRRYSRDDLVRLKFIKSAQRLGFSLDEIAQLLELADGTDCAQAQLLGQQRLHEIRQRIQDLQQMEQALATMLEACDRQGGTVSCPLVMALQACATRNDT